MPTENLLISLPVSVPLLRSIADASEIALLTFVAGQRAQVKFATAQCLVELLETDGFPPGTRLLGNERIKIDGAHKGGEICFSGALLHCLAPMDARTYEPQHRAAALKLFARVVALYSTDSASRQRFLDSLLFESYSAINDAGFFQGLLDLGADPMVRMTSHQQDIHSAETGPQEAALAGNAVALGVIAAHGASSTVRREMYPELVFRYTPCDVEKSEPRATFQLAATARNFPQEVQSMFQAFDAACGPDAVAAGRARVLSIYLAESNAKSRALDVAHIYALIGAPGSSIRLCMAAAADRDCDQLGTEKDTQFTPWRELFHYALAGHCADAIELFPRRLHATCNLDWQSKIDPLHRAASEGAHTLGSFSAENFRRTMEVLVQHGHALRRADLHHPPALHLVAQAAESSDVKLLKLRVLLELGCDPLQLSNSLVTAQSKIKEPAVRAAWEEICRAHQARLHAMTVMASELLQP